MASGKEKNTGLIWILVGAGVILIGLAFIQKKPQENSVRMEATIPAVPSPSAEDMQKKALQMATSIDHVQIPVMVTSPSGEEGPFAIQVYSFQDKIKADIALSKLKEQGYPAYILVSDLGDKGIWHRVRIGSFKNEDEAQQLLQKIRDEFQSGIVVKQPLRF